MAEYRLSNQAKDDLDDIWYYISSGSVVNADRFLDRLYETMKLLAEMPMAGRAREDLAPRLRSFVEGNYLIFYLPIETGIEVVRVLPGSRDITALFRDEDDSR
jgi:toxin ParE1/3/4